MKLKDLAYRVEYKGIEAEVNRSFKELVFNIRLTSEDGKISEEEIPCIGYRDRNIREIPFLIGEWFSYILNYGNPNIQEVVITCRSGKGEFLCGKKYSFLRGKEEE